MERENDIKKNFHFSFKKIKKIWFPVILTILIVFNISFIPNSIGTNENMNFQPSSAAGESYFFSPAYFKVNNKSNKSTNSDFNIAIWVLCLIICVIFGIIYYIKNKLKNVSQQKEEDKSDYIELLKDDSDYEGNI